MNEWEREINNERINQMEMKFGGLWTWGEKGSGRREQ